MEEKKGDRALGNCQRSLEDLRAKILFVSSEGTLRKIRRWRWKGGRKGEKTVRK